MASLDFIQRALNFYNLNVGSSCLSFMKFKNAKFLIIILTNIFISVWIVANGYKDDTCPPNNSENSIFCDKKGRKYKLRKGMFIYKKYYGRQRNMSKIILRKLPWWKCKIVSVKTTPSP